MRGVLRGESDAAALLAIQYFCFRIEYIVRLATLCLICRVCVFRFVYSERLIKMCLAGCVEVVVRREPSPVNETGRW